MNDSLSKEVETEINKDRGDKRQSWPTQFRALILLTTGAFITAGLTVNGVEASYLFGLASILALMWLRGTKST